MNARRWWKFVYRQIRIAHRETRKATQDMMVYGTGVVHVDLNGEIRHIPMSATEINLPMKNCHAKQIPRQESQS